MAVTNLTGTSWHFSGFSSSANNTWNINFYTEDMGVREYWKQIVATSSNTMNYVSTDGTSVNVFYQGSWASDYRDIHITGGSQVTSSSLISWLNSKCTLTRVTIRDYGVNWADEDWGLITVRIGVTDKTKTSYSALPTLAEIQSFFTDFTSIQLVNTFSNCTNLITPPNIPNYQGKCSSYYYTFKNCTSLTTCPVYEDTNPIIFGGTFEGCTSLTTLSLSANPDSIGGCCKNCTALTTVGNLPNSIDNMYGTFENCTSLTTINNFPTGLWSLENCFKGCTSLISVPTIPASVYRLDSAFQGCTSLTTAPVIPVITTYMESTFAGCTSLTTPPDLSQCSDLKTLRDCFFDSGITSMPDLSGCTSLTNMYRAFYGCNSLVNTTAIPSAVTSLYYTFADCMDLTSAPDLSGATAVTTMEGTFNNCVKLSNFNNDLSVMTCLKNLTRCFSWCVSLTTAPTIPSSITDVSYCFASSGIRGTLTVNNDNITTYTGFLSDIFSTQPLKLTGSASTTLLNNLAGTGGTQIYINTDSSLNYANPTIPTFTLIRCNQDGTYNEKGLYAKASFTFSYFKSGTPHDISGRFINNISPITAIINGISNSIAIVYDENNQQYNLSDITDFTKTYHFIIANTNQTSIVMRLQTADTYNASNIKQATLDIANVVNTYLKYKDENNTINIFYPTTPANNVTLLNSGFTYANVEDIIWNELFRKE